VKETKILEDTEEFTMPLGVNTAIVKNDSILLTKRDDFHVWCLPGGRVEPGESIAQAAIRESLEETGIKVRLLYLVGLYSRPKWDDNFYHIALFSAQPLTNNLILQPGEVVDAQYFPFDSLPKEILLGHKQRILDVQNAVKGIAKREDYPNPFEEKRINDIRKMQTESGISKSDFYARNIRVMDETEVSIETAEHLQNGK